jgi:hypothetical protein
MHQRKILVSNPSSTSKGKSFSPKGLYSYLDGYILYYSTSHHMNHSHKLLPSTFNRGISQTTIGHSLHLDGLRFITLVMGRKWNFTLVMWLLNNYGF